MLENIQQLSVRIIFVLILLELVRGSGHHLTKEELLDKYGQANISSNHSRSCSRECNGETKTCYYEFNVQLYDTMSGLCGNCENGTIADCFKRGCVTANGVERVIMTINQVLPGPTIDVCKGDRVIVDVTNHMDGTEFALHWHGHQQVGSQWSDGVPMVTQCPIFAANSFRYIFNAPDGGTHLYHSHSGLHRSNGIYGKLIIREANDPNAEYYDYDLKEHSLVLAEWNNYLAEEQIPGTKNQVILPESLLINGFGQYVDSESNKTSYAPIAAFYVQRGKRHRFRIVNAGSFICPFELSIRNQNLTVISTDGNNIQPIVVEKLVSSPGERFDVVFHAPKSPNANETFLTIRGLLTCEERKLQEFARIVYVDDIESYSAKTLNHPHIDCNKPGNYCIAALQHRNVPPSVDDNLRNEPAIVVPFTFRTNKIVDRPFAYKTYRDSVSVSTINNITNESSRIPALIQDDSDIQYCNMNNLPDHCNSTSVCHCHHLVQLDLCKIYEFLLIDGDAVDNSSHPIHLHGFKFQVIDKGTKEQYEKGTSAFRNATHLPVIKDTTIIPDGGFARIRFRSCNPGYWFFHCHFEHHMHTGMVATIKVGNRSDMPLPPFELPKCGIPLPPVYES